MYVANIQEFKEFHKQMIKSASKIEGGCCVGIIRQDKVGGLVEFLGAIFNSSIRAHKYIDDEIWDFKTSQLKGGCIYLSGHLEYAQGCIDWNNMEAF